MLSSPGSTIAELLQTNDGYPSDHRRGTSRGLWRCLLISCPVGRRTWRLLIDTGPDECLPTLVDRLKAIPLNAQGRRRIDLAVISHIDHDYIGVAARLFADRSLKPEFADIWFNAPSQPVTRGVREGVGLAAVLGVAGRGLPWNLAFGGRDGVTGSTLFVELPRKRGEPFCSRTRSIRP